MKHETIRHTLLAAGLFLATSIVALWAWNTLSALAGLPSAEFHHVLAVFALLAILRWTLLPGRFHGARCRTQSTCPRGVR